MTKKKHSAPAPLNKKITDKLVQLQRNLQSASALIPWKPTHLMVPAESYGPDIEQFRDTEQALVAWNNKRTQTWKFSSVLRTQSGREFTTQLTMFMRQTLHDHISIIPARWLFPRVYGAHFVIGDHLNGDSKKNFRYWQKGGLFGLTHGHTATDKFHIEIGGWYAKRNPTGTISIFASSGPHSASLHLTPSKPLAYHAQKGYFQKSHDSAHASYYCSYSHMNTRGTILLDGTLHDVTGETWLDHEKTSHQAIDWVTQKADRINISLPTDEELMIQLYYDENDNITSFSTGSFIDRHGSVQHLLSTDFKVETTHFWKSSATGSRYPVRRKLVIEKLGIDFEIKPLTENQELDSTRSSLHAYWEGPIGIAGLRRGENTRCLGFMRMSGYDNRKLTKALSQLVK